MKRKLDKQTALKLINQYADNYKRIEDENKALQQEVKDLKSNLNVNKEIIESFFKSDKTKLETQLNVFFSKSKEEINTLNKRNESLTKENSELRIKSLKYESIINDSLSQFKSSSTELENKIFILENSLKKKNNIIDLLNKKIQSFKDAEYQYEYYSEPNEIYIADPNETLNIIYNDLLLYKQAYEKALNKIKENKLQIDNLQTRLAKAINSNNNSSTHESPKSAFATTTKALNEMILKCTKKEWETDEWLAILNYLNITKDDIKNNTQSNKFISKLFEAIELLNKIVVLRNKKINQLNKEKDKLKESNNMLSNENVLLMKNMFTLKLQQHGLTKDSGNVNVNVEQQYMNTNVSMLNNISFEEQQSKSLMKKGNNSMCVDGGRHNDKHGCSSSSGVSSLNNSNQHLNLSVGNAKRMNLTQMSEGSFDIGVDTEDIVLKLGIDKDSNCNNNNHSSNNNIMSNSTENGGLKGMKAITFLDSINTLEATEIKSDELRTTSVKHSE